MNQYRVTEANGRVYIITANSHDEAWQKAKRHACFQVQCVEPVREYLPRISMEEYLGVEACDADYDSHPGDPNNFGDHD